jgi:hypothetical protein
MILIELRILIMGKSPVLRGKNAHVALQFIRGNVFCNVTPLALSSPEK